jgi:O-acetyl-ADP-ribose deacetylase (regulator of RNase III)
VSWQFRAIALPLLGKGPGDLSAGDAAAIVCDVLKTHTRDHAFPSDIRIVVQSHDDKDMLEHMLHVEER